MLLLFHLLLGRPQLFAQRLQPVGLRQRQKLRLVLASAAERSSEAERRLRGPVGKKAFHLKTGCDFVLSLRSGKENEEFSKVIIPGKRSTRTRSEGPRRLSQPKPFSGKALFSSPKVFTCCVASLKRPLKISNSS